MDERVSLGQRLSYACGDFSLGGCFNIVNIFYPIFLSSIVHLDPFLTAAVIFGARVYDAITDIIMGFWSDKTKSRWGRRKPYIFTGTLFLLLSFWLLFYPYTFGSQGMKFVLVLISYIFFYTIQTVISTSYYALGAEMTRDYTERTKILSLRLFFSLLGSGVCSVLPAIVLSRYSYVERELVNNVLTDVTKYHAPGYVVLALLFGGIFTVFLLITGIFVRERKDVVVVSHEAHMLKNIFTPLSIKSARQYLVMQTLKCTCMAFMSTLAPYFATYYLNRPNDISWVLLVMFIAELLALPAWNAISKRLSKAKTFILGAVIWIVAGVLLFFVRPDTAIYMYACVFLLGFGMCGVVLMPNSMFGDCTDLGELKYGDRREGIFAGFESISYKISTAISTAMIMVVLGFTVFKDAPYSAGPVLAIRIMLCFSPLAFLIFGIFTATRYRLDHARHDRLRMLLEKLRAGETDEAEAEALTRELM